MPEPHGECVRKDTVRRGGGDGSVSRGPSVVAHARAAVAARRTQPRAPGGALPSTAVHLAGFVTDDVAHATAVDTPRGGTAAPRAAAAREAGVPVHGRHGESHRRHPTGFSAPAVAQRRV